MMSINSLKSILLLYKGESFLNMKGMQTLEMWSFYTSNNMRSFKWSDYKFLVFEVRVSTLFFYKIK